MAKPKGFNVTIKAFIPVDATDYGKQSAAYAAMDTLTKSGTVPTDFFETAEVVSIAGKYGSKPETEADPIPL